MRSNDKLKLESNTMELWLDVTLKNNNFQYLKGIEKVTIKILALFISLSSCQNHSLK